MPDVRQLLHDAGDAQPVTDLDLDALVGRAGTRRRRRQALRMGAAAAAVLAAVGGLLAVTRGLGDDDALPPSGGDDVRTVSPDAEAFLLEYLTGPYIPNGFLVVAPAASVGLEPELIATGTIEDVQPRGVPADGCDAACPPHWYLDISLRIDRAVHGSVAPGTTITLPVEMLTTPNDPEAVDPPTPAEAASDLVETAPIGQRAVVFARHPPGRDHRMGAGQPRVDRHRGRRRPDPHAQPPHRLDRAHVDLGRVHGRDRPLARRRRAAARQPSAGCARHGRRRCRGPVIRSDGGVRGRRVAPPSS